MKREWRNIPDPGNVAGAWIALLAVPAILVIALTMTNLPNTATTTNRHGMATAGWIAAAIWWGPVILGYIAHLALRGWDIRPRRVWMPLTEDAREVDA